MRENKTLETRIDSTRSDLDLSVRLAPAGHAEAARLCAKLDALHAVRARNSEIQGRTRHIANLFGSLRLMGKDIGEAVRVGGVLNLSLKVRHDGTALMNSTEQLAGLYVRFSRAIPFLTSPRSSIRLRAQGGSELRATAERAPGPASLPDTAKLLQRSGRGAGVLFCNLLDSEHPPDRERQFPKGDEPVVEACGFPDHVGLGRGGRNQPLLHRKIGSA
jgi:hypothetical protein